MPSSGYATISFTAGEQPTTAKWNLVGSNDASFNNGNGFNDAILAWRHFATNTFSAGVQSLANTGSAGGTMYYINLGGIKLLWLTTAGISYSSSGPTYHITLPSGFFTTIQSAVATGQNIQTTSQQTTTFATGYPTTSDAAIACWANATTANQNASILLIGT